MQNKYVRLTYTNKLLMAYIFICMILIIGIFQTINFLGYIKIQESQLNLLRATKAIRLAHEKKKPAIQKEQNLELLQLPGKNALSNLTTVLDTHSKANRVVLHQVQFDESTEVKAAKDFFVNKQKIQLDEVVNIQA